LTTATIGITNEIDKVWEEYASTRCDKAKERLIVHYSPMIKFVVGKMSIFVSNAVDFDDLTSYGIFGLIDAIEKFDSQKGVKFETYASLRIRGAVIDGLRSLDWVPRSLRQKSKQLDDAYAQLESELGREPTNADLAAKLGLTADEVEEEIKKSSLVSLISFDDYLETHHESAEPASDNADESPEHLYEQNELKQTLASAIGNLTEKEQMVVTLYYYEELTLKEISKVMNVSESRASQIHSKAMLKLRTRLGRHKSLLLV